MKKKKHIVLRIFLSVVALLLVVCGITAAMNWELVKGAFHLLKTAPGNNVKAAWIFLTGNSETIQKQITENDTTYSDAVKKVAEDLGGQGLDLSQYTLDRLASGEYSEEELVRLLMGRELTDAEGTPDGNASEAKENPGEAVTDNPTKEAATGNPTQTETKKDSQTAASDVPNVPEKTEPKSNAEVKDTESTEQKTPTDTGTDMASEEVAKCIAKLYVIKSRFTGQLSSLETTMKTTYEALPKEQRVPESRKSIGRQYISTIADMELACDAEVEAALTELTDTLVAQGKDTAVVETLRSAYENEKSLKKAYYLDVYMNGI